MAKIAAAHQVTLGALVRANPQIEDPALIFPGQQVNIPSTVAPGETASLVFTGRYRVRSGDTMRKIARAFRVPLAQLVAANPQIAKPDIIRVGEVINVPPTPPTDTVQRVTTPSSGSGPAWYRTAKREMDLSRPIARNALQLPSRFPRPHTTVVDTSGTVSVHGHATTRR